MIKKAGETYMKKTKKSMKEIEMDMTEELYHGSEEDIDNVLEELMVKE